MPLSFPSPSALQFAFKSSSITPSRDVDTTSAPTSKLARSELYSAWSVADDAKQKTAELSNKAAKEFNKASNAAQAQTGQIELYSAKYYGACILGGLMACVGILTYFIM